MKSTGKMRQHARNKDIYQKGGVHKVGEGSNLIVSLEVGCY